jgi:excisionase family DNA binding protein
VSKEIPSDLITLREAGKLLGVDPATVRRWTFIGKLVGYRIVGRLRVSKAELMAVVEPIPVVPLPRTRAEVAAEEAEVDRVLREARIRR